VRIRMRLSPTLRDQKREHQNGVDDGRLLTKTDQVKASQCGRRLSYLKWRSERDYTAAELNYIAADKDSAARVDVKTQRRGTPDILALHDLIAAWQRSA
jgi:hypothetical protein